MDVAFPVRVAALPAPPGSVGFASRVSVHLKSDGGAVLPFVQTITLPPIKLRPIAATTVWKED